MGSLLRLTRAHTVPLEAVPATVGALLATGGSLTLGVLYWGLFGVLYHLVGYGHNSWADWKNGYDKDDPNKQHHPLNTGELSPTKASRLLAIGSIILVLMAVVPLIGTGRVEGYAIAGLGVASAWMYNERGKETRYKFLYAATAHTSVFAIPYIAMGGSDIVLGLGGASIVFTWVVYQIAISGELKDIQQDEENLLKWMSIEDPTGKYKPTVAAEGLSFVTRVVIGVLAVTVAVNAGGSQYVVFAVSMLVVISIIVGDYMLTHFYADREKALKSMAFIEVLSLLTFIVTFQPIYGTFITVGLFVGSVMWVVLLNQSLWGTILRPDV